MKILHVVPGLNEKGNGIAVAAKLIAQEMKGALPSCSIGEWTAANAAKRLLKVEESGLDA